jgi:hypothetical protein
MKLLDAYNLLVEDGILDNHRYFSELYKLFGFRDDQTVKEYLDFIAHEPVAWLEGFPSKLVSKQTYAKPKTAIIKLLKKDEIVKELGDTYVNKIYDTIWSAFKKEHQRILDKRQKNNKTVLDHFDTESYESLPVPPVRNTISVLPGHSAQSSVAQNLLVESLPDSEHEEHQMERSSEERIRILKDVLYRLCETLPSGASDAFRLLVESV